MAVGITHPARGEVFTIMGEDGKSADYVVKFVRRKLWHPGAFSSEPTDKCHMEDQITQVLLVRAEDIAAGRVPNPMNAVPFGG
jgi:hypothetical protein